MASPGMRSFAGVFRENCICPLALNHLARNNSNILYLSLVCSGAIEGHHGHLVIHAS